MRFRISNKVVYILNSNGRNWEIEDQKLYHKGYLICFNRYIKFLGLYIIKWKKQ